MFAMPDVLIALGANAGLLMLLKILTLPAKDRWQKVDVAIVTAGEKKPNLPSVGQRSLLNNTKLRSHLDHEVSKIYTDPLRSHRRSIESIASDLAIVRANGDSNIHCEKHKAKNGHFFLVDKGVSAENLKSGDSIILKFEDEPDKWKLRCFVSLQGDIINSTKWEDRKKVGSLHPRSLLVGVVISALPSEVSPQDADFEQSAQRRVTHFATGCSDTA